ncbi:hypothetical protein B0J12DRAFT_417591 [Macrophomina phaseolina]|uniref:Uncharacterized protein n=1 Tax=Macrophomina phaseolina TaxID=35725 RepID=A0ABQ8FU96_9PEZI|nr:hypothetical protein B0J12DRAFT_417591 [Macrophomina phaseolina]
MPLEIISAQLIPMSSRRRIPNSRALFEDHAIVAQKNNEHGVWTGCSLSLKFDQTRARGIVNLRLKAEFNEVNARYVTLQLSPENFHQLGADFDPQKVPVPIRQHFGHNLVPQSHGQVIILSISMNTPGRLITPKDAAILTPLSQYQTPVQKFQCLCQATRLLLYIPTRNFSQMRRSALESFISLAHASRLTSTPSDLRDAYTGRGGRESTWAVFNITEPPPSYESQTEQVTFKRVRQESPASQTGASHKKLAGESGAVSRDLPAYVPNTDSDTDFSHLTSPFRSSHAAISPEPGSVQQKLLQEMLRAELNVALPALLREMLPELIRDLLPDALKNFIVAPSSSQPSSEGDNFIERVVVQHLPQAVRDYIILEDPMEVYLYNVDAAIEEARETAVLEVKEATDESISEIKQAETDVVERLTGVNWNVIGKEIMGLTPSQQGSDLHQERSPVQGISRDGIQHHELGELSDGENKIRPANAQRYDRVSRWTGL